MNMNEPVPAQAEPQEKKSHARRVFVWALEIVAVAVSYFQSSAIVRFITAKLGMDVVVEVTGTFGTAAGHNLSTFLSALVAEPRLVAVILAAIILIIDLIVWIVGSITRTARRHRQRTQAINDDYRYLSYGSGEAARMYDEKPREAENTRRKREKQISADSSYNPHKTGFNTDNPEKYDSNMNAVNAGSSRVNRTSRPGSPTAQAIRQPYPSQAQSRNHHFASASSRPVMDPSQIDPYDVSYLSGSDEPEPEEETRDPYDVSYLKNPQDHTPL